MANEIGEALREIMRQGDQVLGATPETDFNYVFLHTIVNYARAKQNAVGALARIREAILLETGRPPNQIDEGQIKARFVNLLQERFNINPKRANDLFEILKEDAK